MASSFKRRATILRCSSARHAGNRYLPDAMFGLDASRETGRTSSCLACRRAIAAGGRGRRKLSQPKPSRKRICAFDGCMEPPQTKRIYCSAHRKVGADRRKVRPQGRSDLEPATRHDMAIKMLAGKW